MLMLIGIFLMIMTDYLNLNTSHVNVNRKDIENIIVGGIFKYISC